ncbi:hypothetical protein KBW71_27475 [Hydrogenophaga aromaticivorans]|uniref:hypothetical protein n=1 Tax=Hydrogenophaga aromaticivorans TaxID=2610898 RepID=UPI001B368AE7|nr:hypothetical protein [Hydrogenophaga aromaticivorans]MBQ0922187.1 hypothetical protein [Hydrogenophaga aromaticivorans]
MTLFHPKLKEAEFFIELFVATQERGESLTRNANLLEEASYLFSAIMNAFYSALDQWRTTTKNEVAYKEFVAKFPEIYSHSHHGGWRSTTVHVQHLPIAHSGYIPPKGGQVDLVFSHPPKLSDREKRKGSVDLVFHPRYYVEYRGEMKEVVAFSRKHLGELSRLLS